MIYRVKIAGRTFRADSRSDVRKLAERYSGKVLEIPVQR
jgi:hypothetical protein